MGIIRDLSTDIIDQVEGDTIGKVLGHNPTVKLINEIKRSRVDQVSEQNVIKPIDELVLNTSADELNAPVVAPKVEPIFGSRINPAVVKSVGKTEELSAEELARLEVLGSSKRNRLKINITGGLADNSSTGISTKAPSNKNAGTGLKVG